MVFFVWQIQEKCIEQLKPLYQVFVDLTKALDIVNREGLQKILAKTRCPSTFVNMFKELHRNMKARVTFNDQLSGEKAINNSVKQGDNPAPTLFSIFFAVLPLRFRTSGRVFILRRFNTKSKIFVELFRKLLYADDAVFLLTVRLIYSI